VLEDRAQRPVAGGLGALGVPVDRFELFPQLRRSPDAGRPSWEPRSPCPREGSRCRLPCSCPVPPLALRSRGNAKRSAARRSAASGDGLFRRRARLTTSVIRRACIR
jgi:hypothetical protein